MKKTIDKEVEKVWFAGICVLVERGKGDRFRLSLKFHRDNPNEEMPEVWVSVPNYWERSRVTQFLEEHHSWILETRERMWAKVKARPMEPYAISLSTNLAKNVFYLFGEVLMVVDFLEGHKLRGRVLQVDNQLQIMSSTQPTLIKKEKWLNEWSKTILEKYIPLFIAKYEPNMGVKVSEWRIKKMKTRWGSCNISHKKICINLHLIHYPIEALEMIVVHEMVHLLEKRHNKRFYGFMDEFFPRWPEASEILKRLNQLGD